MIESECCHFVIPSELMGLNHDDPWSLSAQERNNYILYIPSWKCILTKTYQVVWPLPLPKMNSNLNKYLFYLQEIHTTEATS